MPAKKNNKPEGISLDDLLKEEEVKAEEVKAEDVKAGTIEPDHLAPSIGDDLDLSANEAVVSAAPVESFESTEVAALRAELARVKEELERTSRTGTDVRPTPESELTPEQKQIRALQDQLARANGKKIETAEELFDEDGTGVVIHVLEDGFIFLGRTWYRGQEVSFGPKAFEETKDRFGATWLSMTDEDQFARWGKVKFRRGPWPGQRQYEGVNASIQTKAPITQL